MLTTRKLENKYIYETTVFRHWVTDSTGLWYLGGCTHKWWELPLALLSAWWHFSNHKAEREKPSRPLTVLVEEIRSKFRELRYLEFVECQIRGSSEEKSESVYKSVGVFWTSQACEVWKTTGPGKHKVGCPQLKHCQSSPRAGRCSCWDKQEWRGFIHHLGIPRSEKGHILVLGLN